MAAAYDIPVVPHGSGPYSFQAIMAFSNSDFCEYIANSPDGKTISPSFVGLELNPKAELVPYKSFFTPSRGLGSAGEAEDKPNGKSA
jgi:L-rhamnonate dehydratase